MNLTYEICLADYELLLPEMAEIIKAKYEVGSYLNAQCSFHEKLIDSEEWCLLGEAGRLSVKFEKHEGYYFSEFRALDLAFQKGKLLLWENYIAQGGNPAAQKRP